MHAIHILRLPRALAKTGDSRSTHYAKISAELMPPPVRLGARAVGWPEHELDAILSARMAGKTDDEVRDLVRVLVAARRETATP